MQASKPQEIVTNHFNVLASIYDSKADNRKNYLNAIDNIIINYLGKKEQEKQGHLVILDVGCGTGLRAAKIASYLNSPIVFGIDIAEEMVKQAKKRINHAHVQSMESFYLAVKFDAIFCLFNAFGYLATYKERLQALKNMRNHLKDDGILFIDVMNILHKGEGITFKRTNQDIIKDVISPLITGKGQGNKEFSIKINEKETAGFVHGFFDFEMKWLLKRSGWFIEQKHIIGYDSGSMKQKNRQGQLFYICRKK